MSSCAYWLGAAEVRRDGSVVGGWRGITYTPADVRLLQMIRRDLGLTTSRKKHPEPDPHVDVADAA